MSDQREIKVVKKADRHATIPADEHERRRRELKKIKDELLTLARRVEALAEAELALAVGSRDSRIAGERSAGGESLNP